VAREHLLASDLMVVGESVAFGLRGFAFQALIRHQSRYPTPISMSGHQPRGGVNVRKRVALARRPNGALASSKVTASCVGIFGAVAVRVVA
jgi:hypothetical protein